MISNIMFRFSTFADYSNIQWSAQNIGNLSKEFSNMGFYPNKLYQVDNAGNSIPRIQMISENGLVTINYLIERIDVTYVSNKLSGFDIAEIDDACNDINTYFDKTLISLGDLIQNSNRLAWYTEYAYFDLSDKEKMGFRNRFLNDDIGGKYTPTDEFRVKYAWKTNMDFGELHEDTNVLVTVDRFRQPFDRATVADGYKIGFDINTFWEHKKNRFKYETSRAYISASRSIEECIRREVFSGCN